MQSYITSQKDLIRDVTNESHYKTVIVTMASVVNYQTMNTVAATKGRFELLNWREHYYGGILLHCVVVVD